MRSPIRADMTRKRRGEAVDKMAAAYILQGVLDEQNFVYWWHTTLSKTLAVT